MDKKQELIDYILENGFITKPSLQNEFTTLVDEAISEQLILHNVSNKREQLTLFISYLANDLQMFPDDRINEIVEDYIKG